MKRHKINWRVPKGAELTELDKKVLFYQDKGHLVPTRQLIKTPEQIEGIRGTTEPFRQPWGMRDFRRAVVLPSMRWFAMEFRAKRKFWKKATLLM